MYNTDTTAGNMSAFTFTTKNTVGTDINGVQLLATHVDHVSATSTSELTVRTRTNNSLGDRLKVNGSGITVTGDVDAGSGYIKGNGSLLTNLVTSVNGSTGAVTVATALTAVTLTAGTNSLSAETKYTLNGAGTFTLTMPGAGDRVIIATHGITAGTIVRASGANSVIIDGADIGVGTYALAAWTGYTFEKTTTGDWQCTGINKASSGSGTVTSVTSANADISVATTTTTPVLTLNSGVGASKIVKADSAGNVLFGATGTASATLDIHGAGTTTGVSDFGCYANSAFYSLR